MWEEGVRIYGISEVLNNFPHFGGNFKSSLIKHQYFMLFGDFKLEDWNLKSHRSMCILSIVNNKNKLFFSIVCHRENEGLVMETNENGLTTATIFFSPK